MKELAPLLHLDCPAVGAATMAGYLPEGRSDYQFEGAPLIHGMSDPISATGGLAVLTGSLAPDGSVVKAAAVAPEIMRFSGPARVFGSEEAAVAAYEDQTIKPGEVLVVRYEGPAGGPGMREMLALTALISGGPLNAKVALITDGRFSGGSRGRGHRPRIARGRCRRPHRPCTGRRRHRNRHPRTQPGAEGGAP